MASRYVVTSCPGLQEDQAESNTQSSSFLMRSGRNSMDQALRDTLPIKPDRISKVCLCVASTLLGCPPRELHLRGAATCTALLADSNPPVHAPRVWWLRHLHELHCVLPGWSIMQTRWDHVHACPLLVATCCHETRHACTCLLWCKQETYCKLIFSHRPIHAAHIDLNSAPRRS